MQIYQVRLGGLGKLLVVSVRHDGLKVMNTQPEISGSLTINLPPFGYSYRSEQVNATKHKPVVRYLLVANWL